MQNNTTSGGVILTTTKTKAEGVIKLEVELPSGYKLQGGLIVPEGVNGGILLPEAPKAQGVITAIGEIKLEVEVTKTKLILPTAEEVAQLLK